jgi:hypothetical protein
VPDALLDKKIITLDMALVVAGSMFRGEFEQRLKQVIDEVKENPNIILLSTSCTRSLARVLPPDRSMPQIFSNQLWLAAKFA